MTPSGLRALLARFLTAKSAANRAVKTLTWYEDQITHFILWVETEHIALDDLPPVIDKYLAAERKRGLAASSVGARFRAISSWMNWLAKRKLIPESPMPQIDRPKTPRRSVPYVTLAECNALLESIANQNWTDERDRLIILLLFYSGLRAGELTALASEDIDVKARRVHVRQGKGMKARLVPVHAEVPALAHAYLMLRPQCHFSELIVSSDGYYGVRGPMTPEGVRQMMIRRCRAAGIRYMHPHAWRHGFAMWTLNAGVGLSGVSTLMGHSSTTVTESVYAHWRIGDLEREYNKAYETLKGL